MRKLLSVVFLVMTMCRLTGYSQEVALKTNALYWLTTTPNLSLEAGLSERVTVELFGAYNPWTFKDDKKMKCWVLQPEVKYWLCDRWEGHFLVFMPLRPSITAASTPSVTTAILPVGDLPTVTTGYFPPLEYRGRDWRRIRPAMVQGERENPL